MGLVSCAIQQEPDVLWERNPILLNRGALTEQFVGQTLWAEHDCYFEPELFYWLRDKRGSQAKVDYVGTFGDQQIPIEVKSGHTGRLKSLHMFMALRHSPMGIKISADPLQQEDRVLSLPFYLASEWKRLLRSP